MKLMLGLCLMSAVSFAGDKIEYVELARLELMFGIVPKTDKVDPAAVRERLVTIEQKLHIVSFDDDLQARIVNAKKLAKEAVEESKGFAPPNGVEFIEWVDFWSRFHQMERELKLEPKGAITDRLKRIEKKLAIKAKSSGEYYPRAKEAIRKYLQIMSSHYPNAEARCEKGENRTTGSTGPATVNETHGR